MGNIIPIDWPILEDETWYLMPSDNWTATIGWDKEDWPYIGPLTWRGQGKQIKAWFAGSQNARCSGLPWNNDGDYHTVAISISKE